MVNEFQFNESIQLAIKGSLFAKANNEDLTVSHTV
jgi:hypothetical protein